MGEITTRPAPQPLPPAWARAVANSLTAEFRRTGWQSAKALSVSHPTGNPRAGARTGGSVPSSPLLSRVDLIEHLHYLRGIVDPTPGLHPPLAWTITQGTAVGVMQSKPSLIEPLNALLSKDRWDQPFRTAPNRHGRPTLRTGDMLTPEEAEAILTVTSAARVVVIDENDYWDAVAEDFPAALTIELLLAGVSDS